MRMKLELIHEPRQTICKNTFAYTAIGGCNTLPNNIKGIKSEHKFKESMKKTLLADARKVEMNPFVYYQLTKIV